jgi:hypothetical protein
VPSSAGYAVRDEDCRSDIVQDTMIRCREILDRPAAELPLLFQRILSNATMDWFRRQKVRNAVVKNFSEFEAAGGDGDFDILEIARGLGAPGIGKRVGFGLAGADLASRRGAKSPSCRPVNAKRSSCVTGRNSMSPRRPPPWAARRECQDALLARGARLAKALKAKGIAP